MANNSARIFCRQEK